MEQSLLVTFAPVELSFHRSEGSKNFCSVEHSLLWTFRSSGANVPRTFVPMKLYYHENEYFTNFRYKTRPINLKIAYVHQSPAVNNFQQLICRQCSAGAKQWRRNVSQWDGSSRPTFKSGTARNAFCRPTYLVYMSNDHAACKFPHLLYQEAFNLHCLIYTKFG